MIIPDWSTVQRNQALGYKEDELPELMAELVELRNQQYEGVIVSKT